MKVYSNEEYSVVATYEDTDTPYHIVNNKLGIVESKESNLPQALLIAEQLYRMLLNDKWRQEIDMVFGVVESEGGKQAELFVIDPSKKPH